MKIYDKVFCIKTNDLNKKGTWYTILELNDNGVNITTDDDPCNEIRSNRHYFIHTQVHEWSKFSDHFIDLKTERKQKINKILSI